MMEWEVILTFLIFNFRIYYTKICQSKDFDIEELSKATETKITLPRHGEEGMLTIAGQDRDKIENALKEIHSVIAFIRNQQAALQFISIPLLSKEIQENFLKFKVFRHEQLSIISIFQ